DNVLGSPDRLAAIDSTQLLDGPRDVDFDQLTRLASSLLRVPNALVTLVTADRQQVVSATIDDPQSSNPPGSSQTLDNSFCKHVVGTAQPFVVEDAREHELVRNSPAVAKGVIAYAGIPLEVDGEVIGALCVIDARPRSWSTEEMSTLLMLARSAMRLIEEKRLPKPRRESDSSIQPTEVLDCLSAHLRHLAAYDQLLVAEALDLDAETAAREQVVHSFSRLSDIVGETDAASDPELHALLSAYFQAERQRSEATQSFASGQIDLSELQARIEAQNDVIANLKIAARDRGGEM
ncbi:MAG TPA: GAF domain-containing protein, partial [Sphingomicrobium sp.]|nr:GAF domain-containing protein [Sphingomicrobium sp.]